MRRVFDNIMGSLDEGRMEEKRFNPSKYHFSWTKDWYEWDHKKAHADAKRERDAEVAALKRAGIKATKFTHRNQIMRRGGIGTGRPEIDLLVTVYGYRTA